MSRLVDFSGIMADLFIETGTYMGETLGHAYPHFKRCVSIEQNKNYYESAKAKFAAWPNVRLIHADSPEGLKQAIDPETATTFWLDAHYQEEPESFDGNGECPLLRELEVITAVPWVRWPHILIDDFDAFTSRREWMREQWPTIEEIDAALPGYSRRMRTDVIMQYERA